MRGLPWYEGPLTTGRYTGQLAHPRKAQAAPSSGCPKTQSGSPRAARCSSSARHSTQGAARRGRDLQSAAAGRPWTDAARANRGCCAPTTLRTR